MFKDFLIQKSSGDIIPVLKEIIRDLPDNPLVGVCGGSSIKPVLEAFNEIYISEGESSKISNFEMLSIDERLVPINHPESNSKIIFDELKIEELSSDGKKIFKPFDSENIENSLKEYSNVLKDHDNSFDLTFLGVGEDGHIASLFPELTWPADSEEAFFIFEGSPKPPPKRMSASPETIKNSKIIVLLFFGEGKKEAYSRFVKNEETENSCPVLLARSAQSLYVLRDIS